MATGNLSLAPSERGLSAGRLTGGREFKSFILSLRRGVKKTCRWHVFSPDLGGYAAVADTSLTEGGKGVSAHTHNTHPSVFCKTAKTEQQGGL